LGSEGGAEGEPNKGLNETRKRVLLKWEEKSQFMNFVLTMEGGGSAGGGRPMFKGGGWRKKVKSADSPDS